MFYKPIYSQLLNIINDRSLFSRKELIKMKISYRLLNVMVTGSITVPAGVEIVFCKTFSFCKLHLLCIFSDLTYI